MQEVYKCHYYTAYNMKVQLQKKFLSCSNIGNSFINLSYDYMINDKDNLMNSIMYNIQFKAFR